MSQSPPTTLGKYQIIREIARSNDIVYEAYDPLMNRRVALKELAVPSGATAQQKDERIKRFLREARAAGSLSHPNIMTVYEVGEDAGRNFIAMEYLDGKTLRNELDSKGFLPLDKALDIATQVLEALDYAHSKGVIHRDIKPDNIQLLSGGGIKLTDFGIARLTFEPNLTMDGQVFGTPSYMSPEQVVGRDLDCRSDLFSVGVVLYEMLSGSKPFAGDSVVTITYSIMNRHPDRPQQVNYPFWQVMEKAMDKSPQLRFRDAGEFLASLRGAANASQGVVIDPVPAQALPPVIAQNPYGGIAPQPYPFVPLPGGMQPLATGAPVPVYYPPPPRKPILTPRIRKIMGQALAFVVATTALGGVVFVGLQSFGNAVERYVVNRLEGAESKASSKPTAGGTAKPSAVTPWVDQGNSALQNDSLDIAERNFREAIKARDSDAAAYFGLGQVFLAKLEKEADRVTRRETLRQAAQSFATSVDLAKDPADLKRAKRAASEAYYQLALVQIEDQRRSEARDSAYRARQYARGDDQQFQKIEELRRLL